MAQAILRTGIKLGLFPPDTLVSHRPDHDGAEAIEYLVQHAGSRALISTCTPTFLTTPLKHKLDVTAAALTPICQLVEDSYLLVVPALSEWGNVQDLVRYARQKPGTMTVGAAPKGGNNHIHAHLVAQATGADFRLRFFSNRRELLQALAASDVAWTTAVAAELQGQTWLGKIRVIGVLSKGRSPLHPEIPTLEEQGIPVTFALWRGVIGPPEMPDEARSEMESCLRAITESEDWQWYLDINGQQGAFRDGCTFARMLATEQANYRAWLAAIGVVA
jgi:putative tricarboxylic transport membrane protein